MRTLALPIAVLMLALCALWALGGIGSDVEGQGLEQIPPARSLSAEDVRGDSPEEDAPPLLAARSELSAHGALRIRVLLESGDPAANAKIRWTSTSDLPLALEEWQGDASTDGQGRLRIAFPGPVLVHGQQGAQLGVMRVRPADALTDESTLHLHSPRHLDVLVIGPDGVPVPDVELSLQVARKLPLYSELLGELSLGKSNAAGQLSIDRPFLLVPPPPDSKIERLSCRVGAVGLLHSYQKAWWRTGTSCTVRVRLPAFGHVEVHGLSAVASPQESEDDLLLLQPDSPSAVGLEMRRGKGNHLRFSPVPLCEALRLEWGARVYRSAGPQRQGQTVRLDLQPIASARLLLSFEQPDGSEIPPSRISGSIRPSHGFDESRADRDRYLELEKRELRVTEAGLEATGLPLNIALRADLAWMDEEGRTLVLFGRELAGLPRTGATHSLRLRVPPAAVVAARFIDDRGQALANFGLSVRVHTTSRLLSGLHHTDSAGRIWIPWTEEIAQHRRTRLTFEARSPVESLEKIPGRTRPLVRLGETTRLFRPIVIEEEAELAALADFGTLRLERAPVVLAARLLVGGEPYVAAHGELRFHLRSNVNALYATGNESRGDLETRSNELPCELELAEDGRILVRSNTELKQLGLEASVAEGRPKSILFERGTRGLDIHLPEPSGR